ncbi:MAG TPA: hypothetical protein VGG01_02340 [Xanthobacteraceae bacterium]|jgi:hypothetical protein
MIRLCTFLSILVGFGLSTDAARAGTYPVGGKWTYDNASDAGPAEACGTRTMEFSGAQRFDTVGGASQYRNVSVDQDSPSTFAVVDEFFNVMIRGRVQYTLRIVDKDHIVLRMDRGGDIALRRCG